jgi:redox-sensitive bicupin YhaK (pirin superfamily)
MKTKTIETITTPPVVADSTGIPIRRIIEAPKAADMDPFLLFDYFSAKKPAGFFDHPHRGFELATYVIKGQLIHEDFRGNKEILGPGDFEWSSVGQGVVHSEMPMSETEETVGFILWVNLPKEDKLNKFSYKKIAHKEIPRLDCQGVSVKVLAGEAFGLKGLVSPKAEVLMLDVHMTDDCIFEHIVPKGWSAMCFVYEGAMDVVPFCSCCSTHGVNKNQAARLTTSKEDRLLHIETGKEGSKFLLIAGKPLNEPVHQHGPFVLATQKDLSQAFEDFKRGVNGFEGAHDFASEFGKRPQAHHKHY